MPCWAEFPIFGLLKQEDSIFLTSRKKFGKHKPLAGSTKIRCVTPADISGDSVRPVHSSFEKSHSFKAISVVGISVHHRKSSKSSQSKSRKESLEEPVVPMVQECLRLVGYVLLSMKHGKSSALDDARLVGLNGLCPKLLLRLPVSKRRCKAHCLAEKFSINIRLSWVAL